MTSEPIGKSPHSGMESSEASLETTIPTDFTLSPESDEGKNSKLSLKQQLERKQLLHDLQLLKIELSHKSLIIDNMKAEHMGKIDDLEEKLADVQHQKQVIEARLESQLKLQQEEEKRRLYQTKLEMETILKKQQHLEETNARLQDRAGDVRRSLRELELNEERYYELKEQSPEFLSLKDFVAMKVYEISWPLKVENEEFRSRENRLKETFRNTHRDYIITKDELETARQLNSDFALKIERLTTEVTELKSVTRDVDYKRDNFDKIKREHDQLDVELQSLKKAWSTLNTANNTLMKEKADLLSEVKTARQKLPLLLQDKDYFSKQAVELQTKLSHSEERLNIVNNQLERAQEAREDMYERFITSRDKYKTEYEQRLNEEIDKIRDKTTNELDKLKKSQQEVHELELHSLKEARDNAVLQREKSEANLREVQARCDDLRMELKQLQSNEGAKLSDLRTELKVTNLDLERSQMVEAELTRNLKETQIESEKLHKKIEIITNEVYEQQNKFQVRIAELEAALNDKTIRLQAFEKMEQELDDIVIQAAEVGDDKEAERIMFSFGYGANVPTTAKRRLQQSVQLARRVLALEKLNTTITQELEREKDKSKQITDELDKANHLIHQAEQPYNYLVDGIRTRDERIEQLKAHLDKLESELNSHRQERGRFINIQNQMSQDLERLLSQRQEMNAMRKILLKMQTNRDRNDPIFSDSPFESDSSLKMGDSLESELPEATVFTKGKHSPGLLFS